MATLGTLHDRPAATIRITTGTGAAQTILWPAIATLPPTYPDIKVEIAVDAEFVGIVAERFDSGTRLGEAIGQDMMALRDRGRAFEAASSVTTDR